MYAERDWEAVLLLLFESVADIDIYPIPKGNVELILRKDLEKLRTANTSIDDIDSIYTGICA